MDNKVENNIINNSQAEPRERLSWIKVGRKFYNLDSAVAVEISMGDVIVTFPGYEIANTKYDNNSGQIIIEKIPIQLSFTGSDAAEILHSVGSKSKIFQGRRTVLVCGNIDNQNKTWRC